MYCTRSMRVSMKDRKVCSRTLLSRNSSRACEHPKTFPIQYQPIENNLRRREAPKLCLLPQICFGVIGSCRQDSPCMKIVRKGAPFRGWSNCLDDSSKTSTLVQCKLYRKCHIEFSIHAQLVKIIIYMVRPSRNRSQDSVSRHSELVSIINE